MGTISEINVAKQNSRRVLGSSVSVIEIRFLRVIHAGRFVIRLAGKVLLREPALMMGRFCDVFRTKSV